MPPVSWTVSEKRKLVNLLSIYPLDAYSTFAKKIRSKTEDEVKHFMQKLIRMVRNGSGKRKTNKEPLDVWSDVAADLVDMESFDCASQLSRVMSMVSSFEEFPSTTIEGHPPPDYRSIYRFLSGVLQSDPHEDLERLGPLESAIVLELIHSLMEVLSTADTSVQRNVMRWKYQLMTQRGSRPFLDECRRKAAENDFSEFIEEEMEQVKNLFMEKYNSKTDRIVIMNDKSGPKSNSSMVVESTYVVSDKSIKQKEDSHQTSSVTSNQGFQCQEKAPKDMSDSGSGKQSGKSVMVQCTDGKAWPVAEMAGGTGADQRGNKVTSTSASPKKSLVVPSKDAGIDNAVAGGKLTSKIDEGSIGKSKEVIELGGSKTKRPCVVLEKLPGRINQKDHVKDDAVKTHEAKDKAVQNIAETNVDKVGHVKDNRSVMERVTEAVAARSSWKRSRKRRDKAAIPVTMCVKHLISQRPNFDMESLRAENRPVWQHKRGVKGKYDPPEKNVTEIVTVLPPKNMKIINPVIRKRKAIVREDGKYTSLNKDSEKDDSDKEKICRIEEADTMDEDEVVFSKVDTQELEDVTPVIEHQKRKYACLEANKSNKQTPMKKPKLYSLNPFCLPVGLLDLRAEHKQQ